MGKKIPSCYNCVFAFLDREHTLECYDAGILNWPACANHPGSYGRMKRTPPRGICPNYRPRPATPEGDVCQIPLGDGFYTYVDAADYEWLSQWTWSLVGGYAGRVSRDGLILLHREIMKPPQGMVVDHKNRNKLDNTRDNLRVCTHGQNVQNRGKRRGCSSRFLGVYHMKDQGKYHAYVYYERRQCSCGDFADENEAARAHDAKAVELYGEFARLNFPEEWPTERRAKVYAAPEDQIARRKAAQRKTRSPRATGHKSRAAKKARAETQGRRGARKQTRARTAKPRATRDEKRATKQAKKPGRRTCDAQCTPRPAQRGKT
jgi:hypothetical protein